MMMVLEHCRWCGPQVIHSGPCPRVKAVEYYQDGSVKRVEFRDETPFVEIGPPVKLTDLKFSMTNVHEETRNAD